VSTLIGRIVIQPYLEGEMLRKFAVGDVVQLKSGGPKMVIRDWEIIDGVLQARCEWIYKTQPCTGTFAVTSLKTASGKAKLLILPRYN
jgi:uncharacterized protein YodC (DUF2158 family)